ncbi:MAG: TlpA disulfide reductase family protein [Pseudomonadota bacterium]
MKKRDFLQSMAAGALGLSVPAAFAGQAKPAAAAAPAPKAFTLKGADVYGKAIDLQEYMGKSVLISFFTAECIPCTNDLRLMREFYGANKARNYVNIGVSLDANRADILAYMDLVKQVIPAAQHFPIAWRNAKGHVDNFGPIANQPTHFVLNREHKLVRRRNGIFKADDWDELWTDLA